TGAVPPGADAPSHPRFLAGLCAASGVGGADRPAHAAAGGPVWGGTVAPESLRAAAGVPAAPGHHGVHDPAQPEYPAAAPRNRRDLGGPATPPERCRMNVYRTHVEAAIRATVFHSPTTFSWFGQPSPRLVPAVTRALTPQTARHYVLFLLQSQLYTA